MLLKKLIILYGIDRFVIDNTGAFTTKEAKQTFSFKGA
jgi:hypothetical protein